MSKPSPFFLVRLLSAEFLRECLFISALAMYSVAGAAERVTAVDIRLEEGHTRITLESDSLIKYTLFLLNNPDRLILDLEDVTLNATLNDLAIKVGADHPYLMPIRVGRSRDGLARLEMNFKARVFPESEVLSYKPDGSHGYRLVLDIVPSNLAQSGTPVAPVLAENALTAQVPPPKAQTSVPPVASTTDSSTPGVNVLAEKPIQFEPAKPSSQEGHVRPVYAAEPNANQGASTAKNAGSGDEKMDEMLLEVRINKQEPAEVVLVLRNNSKRLFVKASDLTKWRLRPSHVTPTMKGGESYYRLDDLAGMTYFLNEANQTLDINVEAGLFSVTTLSGAELKRSTPTVSAPGGFFNYDLFADSTMGTRHVSGLLEAGAFGPWGVGVTTFLGNSQPSGGQHFVRLDSTFTRDFPDELKSVRFGDAISGTSNWGRSVRFGGIQWSSNFSVQPSFVPFPLPSLSGEATLPSTVDYYFNGAHRFSSDVPSGPFSIQDLPVVSGQGEARMVVKDILGREQVITQRFYTNPQLLRKGLQSYSYDVGFLRNNFGTESNAYGSFVSAGTHRLGITDELTGEIHGELQRNQQTLGVGGAYALPTMGLLSGSLAASRSVQGRGTLLAVGFDRTNSALSYGFNTQLTTKNFSQIGLLPGTSPPKQVSQAYASFATPANGSISVNYSVRQQRDAPDIRLAGATYSVNVANLGTLGITLIRFFGDDKKTVLSAVFTIPLDSRTTASVNTVAQRKGSQSTVQVQRSLPAGTGVGYRVLAGTGASSRQEAGISAQNDIGTYSIEIAKAQSQTAVRGSISGGVAVLGGDAFLTRRVTESFGVVDVPGFSNVRVFVDNQDTARTNEKGIALLPHLRPYEANAVRIDESNLPLNARIDAKELAAVPYFRSAVRIKFPVKTSHGAVLQVFLETGEPMPAGAIARLADGAEEFPFGLRGEVYLTGLEKVNRVSVFWRDQSCSFDVLFPESTDPVPNLGTFKCLGW